MRRVLLAGAFGQGNPGDDALLVAFLQRMPDWHVVATSSDPDATRQTYGCDAVASNRPADVALHVGLSDAVVFAGGSIFKVLHASSGRSSHELLRRGLMLAAGAKVLGKTVCMLGVGAGRLDSSMSQLFARALAYRASLLVLRDEESAAILTRAGVRPPLRVGTDPAWSLFAAGPERPSPCGDDVVVALSHHAGGFALAGHLVDALRPLAERGLKVKLQP